MKLRPAQQEILKYTQGLMAVSAVPGSGKTFTLALLAARLIADGNLDVAGGQQVLVVTYMNSGADSFRRKIRAQLEAMGLMPVGYDVRTLHSLGLEIVRLAAGGGDRFSVGVADDLLVLDEAQATLFLGRAIDNWRLDHRGLWQAFQPEEDSRQQHRWRRIVEQTARAFIRTAKNERYRPEAILARLDPPARAENEIGDEAAVSQAFTAMFAGIYAAYQTILQRQGALDFDDLIWEAADLVESQPELSASLGVRWPYVLEDEAQDSVPLQEILLGNLAAATGNWVRVGDPNQAITSSFTAAHPRFFKAFADRPDVQTLGLPNSGRCAPLIMDTANHLVTWVCDRHPVPEVAAHTFRRQAIRPTPPGDAQPNPPDAEASIRIKVYRRREDAELPQVARLAARYAASRPDHTLAVLVSTNELGHNLAAHLDAEELDYDNLLRGGTRERRIAGALHALLAILAHPLSTRALVEAHQALLLLGHPAVAPTRRLDLNRGPVWAENGFEVVASETPPTVDPDRLHALLRSVHSPEALLFPSAGADFAAGLPAGVATPFELDHLSRFVAFVARIFQLRPLPIDDLTLALGSELFASGAGDELDLALAFQIASVLRRWRDAEPDWRLPELVLQLADVAAGRRQLPLADPDDLGFSPRPGRITLITQHKAKGLEWDAVFLVGLDGTWLPGSLEGYFLGTYDFLGGNPEAQVTAELRSLMAGESGTFPGRTATESANIEVISERLRLLYVALTRARRFIRISRSRATVRYEREYPAEPATVMGVLYRFLTEREQHGGT